MKIMILSSAFLSVIALSGVTHRAYAETTKTCNPRTSTFDCLVCNCYHEVRGETNWDGIVAINRVVLTRTKNDPSQICKAVYAKNQFTWTFDKLPNNIAPNKEDTAEEVAAGLDLCTRSSKRALELGANGISNYYNPDLAKPSWAPPVTSDCKDLGNHKFVNDGPCPSKPIGDLNVVAESKTKTGSSSTQSRKNEGAK